MNKTNPNQLKSRREAAYFQASMGPGTRSHGYVNPHDKKRDLRLSNDSKTSRSRMHGSEFDIASERRRHTAKLGLAAIVLSASALGISSMQESSGPRTDEDLRKAGWTEENIEAFRIWQLDKNLSLSDPNQQGADSGHTPVVDPELPHQP